MKKKNKLDSGQLIGAIIFIALFIGLVYLGIFSEQDRHFDSGFFEDIGRVMEQ